MTEALQTKCEMCLGGPKMILLFLKKKKLFKGLIFFVLADPYNMRKTFWRLKNFLLYGFLGLWPIPQMEVDDLNVRKILFLTKNIKIIIR